MYFLANFNPLGAFVLAIIIYVGAPIGLILLGVSMAKSRIQKRIQDEKKVIFYVKSLQFSGVIVAAGLLLWMVFLFRTAGL